MQKYLLLGPHCEQLGDRLSNIRTHWTSNRVSLDDVDEIGPDAIVSFGYRFILPKPILERVNFRALNCHISMLPWNRGADPNFWSWVDETPKGISIHWISEELDKGEIALASPEELSDLETLSSSYEILRTRAFSLLTDLVRSNDLDDIPRTAQSFGGSYHRSEDRLRIWHAFTKGWETPCGEVRSTYLSGVE